ncbi:MAG: glutaredoxin family protein [Acidimicrobiia bacterium]|nr:glutaredoxin family protein [Acidimicrobiia bacterium]
MNRFSIDFLTRPGCHLCADAAPAVMRAAKWAGASVREVDIERDDRLVRDFGLRIPVVLARGEVVAEGEIGGFELWVALVGRRFSRSGGS